MINFGISRPTTYLSILALSTLPVTDCKFARAEQPADVIQVNAHILPALLTPMSRLVASPYGDPASLDNPLGVEQTASPQTASPQTVSTKSDAIRSVISQSPTRAATSSPLGSNHKESQNKIALPRTRDFTITAPATTGMPATKGIDLTPASLGVNRSFAMSGL